MKKRILIVLLSLVCALCLALGLTACNKGTTGGGTSGGTEQSGTEQSGTEQSGTEQDDTEQGDGEQGDDEQDGDTEQGGETTCTHTLVKTEAAAATCEKEGNIEYWTCSDCGKYFADGNGTTEITLADTVLAKTEHTYEAVVTEPTCTQEGYIAYTCSGCGDSYKDTYVSANGHTWDDGVVTVEATCTEKGVIIYTCTVCDAVKTESIVANGHNYSSDGVCIDCEKEAVASVGLEYTLSDDEKYYIVSGMGDCTDTEIVIPDTYNGLPVEQVANKAFYGNTAITSIYIAGNVTYIGESAFYGCTMLVIIIIGKGVTTIGNYAFYNCTALTKIIIYAIGIEELSSNNYVFYKAGQNGDGITVTIGASVTKIPSFLFNPCSSKDYAPKITDIGFEDDSKCEIIGDYAFAYCSLIVNITIPDSVTAINGYAFYNSTSLVIIIIGTGITTIENYAFLNCSALEGIYYYGTASQWASIEFKGTFSNPLYYAGNLYLNGMLVTVITLENITNINAYAFNKCTSITYVTIGKSIKSIGDDSFAYCTSITSVDIGDDVTYISHSAFDSCTALVNLTIGNRVNYIGGLAFQGCNSLVNVTIPASVTSISNEAFYVCRSLTNFIVSSENTFYKAIDGNLYNYSGTELIQYAIGKTDTSFTVPDNVTAIHDDAFTGCTYLVSIIIPDSVTSIGSWAFANCSALKNITLPNKLTKISNEMFFNCISLKDITIPNSVNYIGSCAFESCSALESITIGNNVNFIGFNAFYYTGYYINSSNWENGLLFIGNYLVAANRNISGKCTIKEGTTVIASSTFQSCKSLTSIVIPDSVKTIGNQAFDGCTALADITLGSGITYIGNSAFYNTAYYNNTDNRENGVLYIGYYLIYAYATTSEEYSVKEGTTVIANGAFENCTKLKNLTIPDSVITIGDSAFSKCSSLTSITIPYGVTSIGWCAFSNCTALENIIFKNTTGWYVTPTIGVTSGTAITSDEISDSSLMASYFTNNHYVSLYEYYYWYRSEN